MDHTARSMLTCGGPARTPSVDGDGATVTVRPRTPSPSHARTQARMTHTLTYTRIRTYSHTCPCCHTRRHTRGWPMTGPHELPADGEDGASHTDGAQIRTYDYTRPVPYVVPPVHSSAISPPSDVAHDAPSSAQPSARYQRSTSTTGVSGQHQPSASALRPT